MCQIGWIDFPFISSHQIWIGVANRKAYIYNWVHFRFDWILWLSHWLICIETFVLVSFGFIFANFCCCCCFSFHLQPLRLDIKRRLTSRSDRVKCVDLHPTEPWMLCALYNGHVHVMNYENQQLFKDFEVCEILFSNEIFSPFRNKSKLNNKIRVCFEYRVIYSGVWSARQMCKIHCQKKLGSHWFGWHASELTMNTFCF